MEKHRKDDSHAINTNSEVLNHAWSYTEKFLKSHGTDQEALDRGWQLLQNHLKKNNERDDSHGIHANPEKLDHGFELAQGFIKKQRKG